ncbi:hypothetical protein DOT_0429 [Desulfosporosinus sp. OT]|nr:hypothetical protein DOT_0429 [Desulfosporosinus sp. OT]
MMLLGMKEEMNFYIKQQELFEILADQRILLVGGAEMNL